jgi:hypothetical protein
MQLEDVLPLAGIVAGELLQERDMRLDLGGGEVVGGKIFRVAGVEKARCPFSEFSSRDST